MRCVSTRTFAIAAGVLAAACFGTQFAAGRHGSSAGLTPLDLVTIRFGGAASVLVPVLLWLGVRDLGGLGWRRGIVLAALGGAPYAFVVMLGISLSSAVHASVLNPGLTPVAGAALSRVVFGQRLSPRSAAGLVGILAGLVLVARRDGTVISPQSLIGDGMLASSAVAYGLYAILLAHWRCGAVAATASATALSALMCVPVHLFVNGPIALLRLPVHEVVLQVAVQGILAGCIGALLFAWATSVLGARTALLFPALVPIFGVAVANRTLGEEVSWSQVAGVLLVSAGITLAAWRRRSP